MKQVYLVRHAKAVKEVPEGGDLARRLQPQGIQDAKEIAQRLKADGIRPDLILVSAAPRAVETAQILARVLGYPKKDIVLRKEIYEANKDALAGMVVATDDDRRSVMLVGHNPGMEELARDWGQEPGMALTPASVAYISFRTTTWRGVAKKRGTLRALYQPVEKEEEGDDISKKELRDRLCEAVQNVLAAIHPQAARDMAEDVRKAAKKLVKKFMESK
jgi:phosphohistidine phosphatase